VGTKLQVVETKLRVVEKKKKLRVVRQTRLRLGEGLKPWVVEDVEQTLVVENVILGETYVVEKLVEEVAVEWGLALEVEKVWEPIPRHHLW
jgi:hypothetical protein